jgi:hypothetical protein
VRHRASLPLVTDVPFVVVGAAIVTGLLIR